MDRREALKSVLAAAIVAHAPLLSDGKDEPAREEQLPKAKVRETVLHYLAAWSERDPKRRLELVSQTWVENGTYIDHAREGNGYESISAMIAKAQVPLPGYRIALASGIETHHEYVRFSWVAGGAPDTPLYIKGTDVAILAVDGRFKSVIGFVDAAP